MVMQRDSDGKHKLNIYTLYNYSLQVPKKLQFRGVGKMEEHLTSPPPSLKFTKEKYVNIFGPSPPTSPAVLLFYFCIFALARHCGNPRCSMIVND